MSLLPARLPVAECQARARRDVVRQRSASTCDGRVLSPARRAIVIWFAWRCEQQDYQMV